MFGRILRFRNQLKSTNCFCSNIECSVKNSSIGSDPHIPVMLDECVDSLKLRNGETIIDMTFGAGGHSKKILENFTKVKLICLDRDPVAFAYAEELSRQYPSRVLPLFGKFSDLPELFKEHNISQNSIDSIIFDFGCSSMQFDEANRGFSVSKNGPLDMRMDGNRYPGNNEIFILLS